LLSRRIVDAIDRSLMLRVQAGAQSDHRFIGIWAVVADGRVFARSWMQKPDGWYRTFLKYPQVRIQVADFDLAVRAVRIRSERVRMRTVRTRQSTTRGER